MPCTLYVYSSQYCSTVLEDVYTTVVRNSEPEAATCKPTELQWSTVLTGVADRRSTPSHCHIITYSSYELAHSFS